MNLALPLNEMTVAEKLQVIEVLWDDLARNPADVSSPPWHGDILADRQRQLDAGQAKFLSLDQFRQSIRKETQ